MEIIRNWKKEFGAILVGTAMFGGYAFLALEQDLSWGVLAINTDRSIYAPGGTAKISMAVLDEKGAPVCDAEIFLTIKDPLGRKTLFLTTDETILTGGDCSKGSWNNLPDYRVFYNTTVPGEYQMIMEATTAKGKRTIKDFFLVQKNPDFDVRRIAKTRIVSPWQEQMDIMIRPQADFKGIVEEELPTGFKVVSTSTEKLDPEVVLGEKPELRKFSALVAMDEEESQNGGNLEKPVIRWQADFKAGETYRLSYIYKAPKKDPEFYELGPLRIGNLESGILDQKSQIPNSKFQIPIFQEARAWQIAVDTRIGTSLPPNGDGTTASWTSTGAAFYTEVDEGTVSPNDNDYIQGPNKTTKSIWLQLTDMPADFSSMEKVDLWIREVARISGNDTVTMGIQLDSPEGNVITNSFADGGIQTATATLIGFGKILNSTTTAAMNAARLKITQTYNQVGPADVTALLKVMAVEVDIWYKAASIFTQNEYRWYADAQSVQPSDPWGNPDLAINTPIPFNNAAVTSSTTLRLRLSLTAGASGCSQSIPSRYLGHSNVVATGTPNTEGCDDFELAYAALTNSSTTCSAANLNWTVVSYTSTSSPKIAPPTHRPTCSASSVWCMNNNSSFTSGLDQLMVGWGTQDTIGYNNTGSTTGPIWSRVAAPEWDITISNIGSEMIPALGDLDGDGDYDMMAGDDQFTSNNNKLYGIENLGNNSFGPRWSASTTLNFRVIVTGIAGSPNNDVIPSAALADMDGDGDLDMMVGTSGVTSSSAAQNGYVYYVKNIGSRASTSWKLYSVDPVIRLETGATESFMVALVDIDNDGDYDIFAGRVDGTSAFYMNTGTAASSTWVRNSTWDLPNAGGGGLSVRPIFADLDGDGDYDVLIGDFATHDVLAYKNTGTVASSSWARMSSWDLALSATTRGTYPALGQILFQPATTTASLLKTANELQQAVDFKNLFSVASSTANGSGAEWDISLLANNVAPATQYCFRAQDPLGNAISSYTRYPMLLTAPATDNLMRHGNFFSSEGLEQGFFWAL